MSLQLKVAIDAVSAAPGGGTSYLRSQLPVLARSGVSVLLFAQPSALTEFAHVLPDAEYAPAPTHSVALRVLYSQMVLPARARHWGADVIYCPGSISPLFTSLPCVVCIQNGHLFLNSGARSAHLSLARVAAWLSALRASQIIHLSHAAAHDFSLTTALARQGHVLYSGPGTQSQHTRHLADIVRTPSARPYLLVVSNIYNHKRIDVVIHAFASQRALRDHFDLVVAGGGTPDTLIELTRQLGCEGQVRFPGFVQGDTLADLYDHAAVYVSASELESFPLTPAEALRAGIPTVLPDLAVYRELYGDLAYFFRAGDPMALATAIQTASRNGPVPYQQEQIASRFSWDRNGIELAYLLCQASREHRPSLRRSLDFVQFTELGTLAKTLLGTRRASP